MHFAYRWDYPLKKAATSKQVVCMCMCVCGDACDSLSPFLQAVLNYLCGFKLFLLKLK